MGPERGSRNVTTMVTVSVIALIGVRSSWLIDA